MRGPVSEILATNLFGGDKRLCFFTCTEIFARTLSVLVIAGNLEPGLS